MVRASLRSSPSSLCLRDSWQQHCLRTSGFRIVRRTGSPKSHLLAAVWTAEAYGQGHDSYVGMDAVDLLKIDPRVPATVGVASAERRTYCLTESVRGRTWSISGPYRGDADPWRTPLAPESTCRLTRYAAKAEPGVGGVTYSALFF